VGQQATAGSPRGKSDLTAAERDSADNLVLICASHHDEIDRDAAARVVTVERLLVIKRRHEEFVRRVTGMSQDRRTIVLRMLGDVRGDAVELSRPTAAAAVLSEERYPSFALSHDGEGIEIDLRQVAGEVAGTAGYWAAAMAIIDRAVEHKLREGVRIGAIAHVSVFAYARLPLLVYLGAAIDDTFAVDVFQRRRTPDTWAWSSDEGQSAAFETTGVERLDGPEAVLVLNVSGTVEDAAVPAHLQGLPRAMVRLASGVPGVNAIATRRDLEAFELAVRALLAATEANGKAVKRFHVLAALPVSAAVALGRSHDARVHPALVIYYRTDAGKYEPALEITA
jgi:hypothetical protein